MENNDIQSQYATSVAYIFDNSITGPGFKENSISSYSNYKEFSDVMKDWINNINKNLNQMNDFYEKHKEKFQKLNDTDAFGFLFNTNKGFIIHCFFSKNGFECATGLNSEENKICVSDGEQFLILNDDLENMNLDIYENGYEVVKKCENFLRTHIIYETSDLLFV